jgi:hypothetical protein
MSTELEDLVADSLRRQAAAVTIPASLAQLARRVRRRRQRQLGALSVGTAAVGTAAVLVVAISVGNRQAAPGTLRAETAAYIVSRAEKALARDTPNVIEYVRMTGSPPLEGPTRGGSAVWSYGSQNVTVYYAADGSALVSEGFRSDSQLRTFTIVNYVSRTWWRDTYNLAGRPLYSLVALAPPRHCEPSTSVNLDPSPQWIRYYLECGLIVMVGRQHVDGIDAVKFVSAKPLSARPSPAHFSLVLWINPATYLPVRTVVYTTNRQRWEQQDMQWLPPTHANMAKVRLPIPTGFHRVTWASIRNYPVIPWIGRASSWTGPHPPTQRERPCSLPVLVP